MASGLKRRIMRTSFLTTKQFCGVLGLLLWSFLPGCGSRDLSSAPNLVLIVLDTTRPEFLSVYGHENPTTPGLEAFAKQGTRFDNAYSVSSWTFPAHTSMFTGVYPDRHGATQTNLVYKSDIPLLAEKLKRAGYDTFGISNNPWISRKTGLDKGFDELIEIFRTQSPWKKEAQKRLDLTHPTVAALEDWLDNGWEREKPFFVFINLIEPHMPFEPPWEHTEQFVEDKAAWKAHQETYFSSARALQLRHYKGENPLEDSDWDNLRSLYEGELHHVDEITQDLIAAIDENSNPDNTTVVITSDHGENIGDHGFVGHVFSVYDTTLQAVMLARGPGFKPEVRDELVTVADVYPTLLNAAGVKLPEGTTGLDLRSDLPKDRILRASYGRPGQAFRAFPKKMRQTVLKKHRRSFKVAIGPRFKVIESSDGVVEWFDLQNDPHEQTVLTPEQIPEETRKRLEASLATQVDAPTPTTEEQAEEDAGEARDEETTEALRALGYVE